MAMTRIRLAVAVDADGTFQVDGWNRNLGDDPAVPVNQAEIDRKSSARVKSWFMGTPCRVSFIEADVPLPEEPTTVQAAVVEEAAGAGRDATGAGG